MWPPDGSTSPLSRYLIGGVLAVALSAAPATAQLKADLVVSGLTQPVALIQDPSDPTVQVVVQQDGRVRVLRNGALQTSDYLDLRSETLNSGEQGLLGLAFAPDYGSSGRVFVNFINRQGHTVIARFTRATGSPLRADPASRFDLLWSPGQRFISQPFANHNGGNVVFGPDGYLYIGMGDGGSGNDPLNHAQNPQSLLGKMLRIDVNVAASDPEGYNVPPTNPFVGNAAFRPEIWSMGLRNPWRWSFDNARRGGTGAMVIGDVGQNAFEEIDYEPPNRGGRNYGWPQREGAHNNVPGTPFSAVREPIFEYGRSSGGSITGGYVYRGSSLGPAYNGRYFYGDFISSRIWSLQLAIDPSTGEAAASDLREHTAELGSGLTNVSSFAEDASGELYVLSYAGRIYRIGSPVPLPTSPRSRPADAPVVGIAAPRNRTPQPASNPSARAKQTVSAPAFTPPVSSVTLPTAETRRPRAELVVKDGDLWVIVTDERDEIEIPLRDFINLIKSVIGS